MKFSFTVKRTSCMLNYMGHLSLNVEHKNLASSSIVLRGCILRRNFHVLAPFKQADSADKPPFLPYIPASVYKSLNKRIGSLPMEESTPKWSPSAAVSSIIYETSVPVQTPPKNHVLHCLVQNEPGVLSRVSGILAARGFNIESLVVCNTDVKGLSRMTIVIEGQDRTVEQARRQLEDIVPVWAVLDYTYMPLVKRELLLAKVLLLGPEFFEELMTHHRELSQNNTLSVYECGSDESIEEIILQHEKATAEAVKALRHNFHPSKLAFSEALRHKHEHLAAISRLTEQFGGRVLDISSNNCIVELCAKPSRVDSFLKLIQPFGILESSRTGLMAIPRSPLNPIKEQDLESKNEGSGSVDESSLPPG